MKLKKLSIKTLLFITCFIIFQIVNLFSFANAINVPETEGKLPENEGVITEILVDKDGVDGEAVFKITNVETQEFVEKTELDSKITDIDVVEGNTYLLELKENEAFEPYSVQFFVGVDDNGVFKAFLEEASELDSIVLQKATPNDGVISELSVDKDGVDAEAVFKITNLATQEFVEKKELDSKITNIDVVSGNTYLLELKENEAFEPYGVEFSVTVGDDNTFYALLENNTTLDTIQLEKKRLESGWREVDDKWYYIDENGENLVGWYYDNTYHGMYYLDADGVMVTGWHQIEGVWYRFAKSGKMATGWVDDEDYNSWYHFDENGEMTTGWIYDEDYASWYYLHDNGKMATSWVDDEDYDSWYHFDDSGKMTTGWVYDESYSSWYYLHDDGKMATGWYYDEDYDSWYYFNNNGKMAIGWIYDESNKSWYYLHDNGKMATGWIYDNKDKKYYYLETDGKWNKSGISYSNWYVLNGEFRTNSGSRYAFVNDDYIILSLKDQKLWLIKNNRVVAEVYVITGKDLTPTPPGNYRVVERDKDAILSGGSYSVGVDYWLGFIGSMYGIHDASWRLGEYETFKDPEYHKLNGSHGCVNIYPTDMAKVYDNAYLGMPVIIIE